MSNVDQNQLITQKRIVQLFDKELVYLNLKQLGYKSMPENRISNGLSPNP